MRWLIGWGSLLAGAALAADPVPPAASMAVPTSPASATLPTDATPDRKPLDLRVGDVRNYMTPEEFRALLDGRELERNTIVVQAQVPLLPMKSRLDVPGGIFAPFWALAHPTQAWRIFLPDARVDIKDIPPPENKIPPPVFRWGP